MNDDYEEYARFEAEKNTPAKARQLLDQQKRVEPLPKSLLSSVTYWKLYRKGQELQYSD